MIARTLSMATVAMVLTVAFVLPTTAQQKGRSTPMLATQKSKQPAQTKDKGKIQRKPNTTPGRLKKCQDQCARQAAGQKDDCKDNTRAGTKERDNCIKNANSFLSKCRLNCKGHIDP